MPQWRSSVLSSPPVQAKTNTASMNSDRAAAPASLALNILTCALMPASPNLDSAIAHLSARNTSTIASHTLGQRSNYPVARCTSQNGVSMACSLLLTFPYQDHSLTVARSMMMASVLELMEVSVSCMNPNPTLEIMVIPEEWWKPAYIPVAKESYCICRVMNSKTQKISNGLVAYGPTMM